MVGRVPTHCSIHCTFAINFAQNDNYKLLVMFCGMRQTNR